MDFLRKRQDRSRGSTQCKGDGFEVQERLLGVACDACRSSRGVSEGLGITGAGLAAPWRPLIR